MWEGPIGPDSPARAPLLSIVSRLRCKIKKKHDYELENIVSAAILRPFLLIGRSALGPERPTLRNPQSEILLPRRSDVSPQRTPLSAFHFPLSTPPPRTSCHLPFTISDCLPSHESILCLSFFRRRCRAPLHHHAARSFTRTFQRNRATHPDDRALRTDRPHRQHLFPFT